MNGKEYYREIHECNKAAIISLIIGTILNAILLNLKVYIYTDII